VTPQHSNERGEAAEPWPNRSSAVHPGSLAVPSTVGWYHEDRVPSANVPEARLSHVERSLNVQPGDLTVATRTVLQFRRDWRVPSRRGIRRRVAHRGFGDSRGSGVHSPLQGGRSADWRVGCLRGGCSGDVGCFRSRSGHEHTPPTCSEECRSEARSRSSPWAPPRVAVGRPPTRRRRRLRSRLTPRLGVTFPTRKRS
jgi:hypothetical protein